MKYFEIQDTPELKYAPQLKDWYGKFDVRDIRINTFPKLPDMQLFMVESVENIMFTDIILFPFLLVSPMVQEVINMYRERCFFRKVILLDQLHKESHLYYLPVLDEVSDILLQRIKYSNGACVLGTQKPEGEEINPRRNIFWVRDSNKRHIVLSMDMAESLIRRNVKGLGLAEVILVKKAEGGKQE